MQVERWFRGNLRRHLATGFVQILVEKWDEIGLHPGLATLRGRGTRATISPSLWAPLPVPFRLTCYQLLT